MSWKLILAQGVAPRRPLFASVTAATLVQNFWWHLESCTNYENITSTVMAMHSLVFFKFIEK